jgi:hypothetical protein
MDQETPRPRAPHQRSDRRRRRQAERRPASATRNDREIAIRLTAPSALLLGAPSRIGIMNSPLMQADAGGDDGPALAPGVRRWQRLARSPSNPLSPR